MKFLGNELVKTKKSFTNDVQKLLIQIQEWFRKVKFKAGTKQGGGTVRLSIFPVTLK